MVCSSASLRRSECTSRPSRWMSNTMASKSENMKDGPKFNCISSFVSVAKIRCLIAVVEFLRLKGVVISNFLIMALLTINKLKNRYRRSEGEIGPLVCPLQCKNLLPLYSMIDDVSGPMSWILFRNESCERSDIRSERWRPCDYYRPSYTETQGRSGPFLPAPFCSHN